MTRAKVSAAEQLPLLGFSNPPQPANDNAEPSWTYDVKRAKLGTLVRDTHCVIHCRRCGKPGVFARNVRKKGAVHRRISHLLEFYVQGSETKCVYADCCTEPAPVPAGDKS